MIQIDDNTRKAIDWWNNTLSMNEQKSFAAKHLLSFIVPMLIGNLVQYTSIKKYYELIVKVWEQEINN